MADQEVKRPMPDWLKRAVSQHESGVPFDDLPVVLNPAPKGGPLPKFELDNGQLKVGDVVYQMEADISIERFNAYQRWETEASFGLTYKQMMGNWRKVWDMVQDGGRNGEIGVVAYNTMQGITRQDENDVAVLKLCAVFLNAPDEDRTGLDLAVVDRKMNHWREAGVPIQFFIQLSAILINGFIADYNAISQGIISGNRATESE